MNTNVTHALLATIALLVGACAVAPSSSDEAVGQQGQAMINEGGGGLDCGNCLGGECAALNCFENWTHGGGGSGGPYTGGGGGGGGGSSSGGSSGSLPDCPPDFGNCERACADAFFACLLQAEQGGRKNARNSFDACRHAENACLGSCPRAINCATPVAVIP